jgi:hypothetical protein
MERVSVQKNIAVQSGIHEIKSISFEGNNMNIIIDGTQYTFETSVISSKLANASVQEKNFYTISPSGYGIHWPAIDEDLSIEGLLSIKK